MNTIKKQASLLCVKALSGQSTPEYCKVAGLRKTIYEEACNALLEKNEGKLAKLMPKMANLEILQDVQKFGFKVRSTLFKKYAYQQNGINVFPLDNPNGSAKLFCSEYLKIARGDRAGIAKILKKESSYRGIPLSVYASDPPNNVDWEKASKNILERAYLCKSAKSNKVYKTLSELLKNGAVLPTHSIIKIAEMIEGLDRYERLYPYKANGLEDPLTSIYATKKATEPIKVDLNGKSVEISSIKKLPLNQLKTCFNVEDSSVIKNGTPRAAASIVSKSGVTSKALLRKYLGKKSE